MAVFKFCAWRLYNVMTAAQKPGVLGLQPVVLTFCLHDLLQVAIWVLSPIKEVCLHGVSEFNNILGSM